MAHQLKLFGFLLMVGVLSWLSQPLSSSSVQDPAGSCVCQQSCQGTIETTPLRGSVPSESRNPSSGCVCMQTCRDQEQNSTVIQELQALAAMMINLQQQVAALNDSLYELMTARLPPPTVTPARPACPSNYVQNQAVGLCYKIYQEGGSKLSWEDAKERCESFGSRTRLAVLDTREKYLHIQQVLPTALDEYNLRPGNNWAILTAWIGARQDQSQNEARYLWLTGEEVTGVQQQQNNDQSGQCMAFEHNRPLFWMTEFVNDDCTEPHWYICEVDQEVN